jgi:hypothetical protein
LAEIEIVRTEEGFAVLVGGMVVARATCRVADGKLEILKIFTEPEHRGRGLATKLMEGVERFAVEQGLELVPLCPFASAYLRKRMMDEG